MGFHVILLKDNGHMEHRYVETADKLAYIPELRTNSIIYQGEAHWTPVMAGESEQYKLFTEQWYRAGMKAQDVFRSQARLQGYMVECINQDKESFEYYTNAANGAIKRGDFLIRNARNLEVEVKCRTFYGPVRERYFYLSCKELDKLFNMSEHTDTPIVLAVYNRKGDGLEEDKLYMCEVRELSAVSADLIMEKREHIGASYQIPLALTKKGFKVLEKYKRYPKSR